MAETACAVTGFQNGSSARNPSLTQCAYQPLRAFRSIPACYSSHFSTRRFFRGWIS